MRPVQPQEGRLLQLTPKPLEETGVNGRELLAS